MSADAWGLMAIIVIAALAAGFAWGRRRGRREGWTEGLRYAPLETRRISWARGRCAVCGRGPSIRCTRIHSETLYDPAGTAHAWKNPSCGRQGSPLHFAKMHGLGNSYVFGDLVSYPGPQLDDGGWSRLARAVSSRATGIGSDGLILLLPSERAHVRMRVFNADGSEGEMCGNGIRCAALYAYQHGLVNGPEVAVETAAGVLSIHLDTGKDPVQARVAMGRPRWDPALIPLDTAALAGDGEILKDGRVLRARLYVGDNPVEFAAVSMGNPHCVIFVPDVDRAPVATLGPLIEAHPAFPRRVNVEFVQVVSPGRLRMRVWERGSGETQACGTGACASLVVAAASGLAERKATVSLLGGDLYIEWDEDDQVYMTGTAVTVCEGELDPAWIAEATALSPLV